MSDCLCIVQHTEVSGSSLQWDWVPQTSKLNSLTCQLMPAARLKSEPYFESRLDVINSSKVGGSSSRRKLSCWLETSKEIPESPCVDITTL
jgi:hypothetical protein